jgi:hypothetical protein
MADRFRDELNKAEEPITGAASWINLMTGAT